MKHCKEPCAECPWKRKTPTHKFPAEAFRRLAYSAYDMSLQVFTCHMSSEATPAVCAGFLLQCEHNLSIRLAQLKGDLDVERIRADAPLFSNFKEMAVANGVDPNDPCLKPCRD